MSVRERAHAKINLTLQVLGRWGDGYHEIESLVTFASLHDSVTLTPGGEPRVTVTGPFGSDIAGENLLTRTLALLGQAGPALALGAVHLDKVLPVAAGLGGGSADAAALLRAVRRMNAEAGTGIDWQAMAARLGADVPVCLHGQPAMMRGVGEKVEPVALLPAVNTVLVNPRLPLPTAGVFAALGAQPLSQVRAAQVPPALEGLPGLIHYVRARGNDLERPAVALLPAIRDIKAALRAEPGCLLAAMSGSGPTCFGVFADGDAAQRAAMSIGGAHPAWWVAPTLLQGAPAD